MCHSEYWNPRYETMSRDELVALQNQRLSSQLHRAYEKNEYFRKKLDAHGVHPDDVRTIEDLPKLPFMTKDDFRQNYPLGMCLSPREELREFHMSSGSTGTPVVMPYTQADIDQWGECMARCYRMAGLYPGDSFQITPTFGLFNGGFGFFHGAAKAGLFAVPASSGNTPRQIKLLHDFKVKGIGCVVSYMARIMEVADELKMDFPDLKVGIFGSETFSDEMRRKIEARAGIKSFDIYGMTETGGVGTTGMDCQAHCGIHIWEDQYITEVVAPETGKVLPDGQYGDVVITSLTREALPVFRFRTRDISRILSREKCACGRTSLRIDRIDGRLDDMLIIKGVNFFPKQVEQALLEIPGVLPEYQIIIESRHGINDIRINVEAEPGVTGFTVAKHLKERLGFSTQGDVFAPGTLPRPEGKAKRVVKVNVD